MTLSLEVALVIIILIMDNVLLATYQTNFGYNATVKDKLHLVLLAPI